MPGPGVVLGSNQYGKAEVRLVRITRDTARHEIEDLNVSSQLRGDFADVTPDRATTRRSSRRTPRRTPCTPSPRRRRRVAGGVPAAARPALRRRRSSGSRAAIWQAEQYSWERIPVDGAGARPRVRARPAGRPAPPWCQLDGDDDVRGRGHHRPHGAQVHRVASSTASRGTGTRPWPRPTTGSSPRRVTAPVAVRADAVDRGDRLRTRSTTASRALMLETFATVALASPCSRRCSRWARR